MFSINFGEFLREPIKDESGQGTAEFTGAIKIAAVSAAILVAFVFAAQNGLVEDRMFRKLRVMASSSSTY
jgi:hypothetical protein